MRNPPRTLPDHVPGSPKAAFTLVELLTVMSIIVVMLAISVPPMISYRATADMNAAISGVSALLSQARTYAMAHNTYVWVGFAVPAANTESLLVGMVASKSGQSTDIANSADYAPLYKPTTFNQVMIPDVTTLTKLAGMATTGSGSGTDTYTATDIYSTSPSTLGTFTENNAGASVTFGGSSGTGASEILQFSPQGEATISSPATSTHWIQIGLQPIRGSAKNTKNVAIIQVAGLTGQVLIFRP